MGLRALRDRLSVRRWFKDKSSSTAVPTSMDDERPVEETSEGSTGLAEAGGVGNLNLAQCLEVARVLGPYAKHVVPNKMYLTVILSMLEEIANTDVNVLINFYLAIDKPIPQDDLVGESIRYFQQYQVVDILALAKEASLL